MKVEQHKLDVSVHGAQETQAFTIKASAKAFQILSEGLYSNKIAAVIRELSSNAYDAHVDAGCPEKPFHIKMPNSLDPTFKIRDWGTGLSDEDIHAIYTTFFESTKTDSNDAIGCLGLGSKSFFAVCDSANITSYFNGVRSVYIAYLDENRIPSLSTFSQMETDEANGIEIEVAIKKDETKYFRDEVNNQLKYFKVKPTISGDSQFEWDLEEEYVYEGTDWKMVGAGRYDKIRAIQGQVSYPIQTHNMGAKADSAPPALKALLNTNLLLTFAIGEININPSRETLSYDTATIKNIFDKAQVVLEELPAQIAKRFDNIETEWEARLLYRDICSSLGGSGTTLLNKIEETGVIKWNGMDISKLEITFPGHLVIDYRAFNKAGFGKWKKDTKRLNNGSYGDEVDPYWDFSVQKNKLIVYVDGNDKSVDARTKQYCNDNHRSNVNILETPGTDDTYELLREALGHPEMVRASTFEKVRRVKSTGPKDNTFNVQYYTSGWTKSEHWSSYENVESLLELEGLYVNLDRVNVMHNGEIVDKFSDFMNVVKGWDILDGHTVFGLRTRNQGKEHEFENFFDYVQRKLIEKGMKVYKFSKQVFDDQINDDSYFRSKILKEMPKSSDLYKISKALDDNIKNKIRSKDQLKLKLLGIDIDGKDMTKLTERVHEKYPMIKGSRYRCTDEQIINYSKQMDKLEKLS